MLQEIKPGVIRIKYQQEDLFSVYDVDFDHRIHNERRKTIQQVCSNIIGEFKEQFPDIYGTLDYLGPSVDYDLGEDINSPFPEFHWIAVYYVEGGSEGYYIHVDVLYEENKRKMILLGKTLLGRSEAEKIANCLSRIIKV